MTRNRRELYEHTIPFWIGLAIIVALSTYALVVRANADTTSSHRKTQREIVVVDNPTTYLVGEIEDAQIFKYKGNIVTNFRIRPANSSPIFDRNIAFCDNVAQDFNGKGLYVAIAYDKVMHTDYCYDLLGVYAVQPTGQ